jgi:hypothetical protein
MQLLKLVPSLVKLGEPLPWNVRDAQGHLLLARGHLMETAADLEHVLERGAFVNAEEAREVARRAAEAEKLRQQQQQPQRPINLFTLWERTLWHSTWFSSPTATRTSRSTCASARTRSGCRSTAWRTRSTARSSACWWRAGWDGMSPS